MKFLFQLIVLVLPLFCYCQVDIEVLESELKDLSGFDKLSTLNTISAYYQSNNPRKFRKYSRQGYVLAENFEKSEKEFSEEEASTILVALNHFGASQYQRNNYLDAKGVFQKAQSFANQADNQLEEDKTKSYLAKIDSLADGSIKDNFFNRALTDLNIANIVSNTNDDVGIAFELKMARFHENKNDTLKAINHYRKAADLFRDKGEFDKAEEIEAKIVSYRRKEALVSQLEVLQSVSIQQEKEDSTLVGNPGEVQKKATVLLDQAIQLEANNDYEAALEYYKEYTALQRKLEKDSLERETQRAAVLVEMDRLKQENEIADLNITAIRLEKEAQVRSKNALFIGLAIIGIAAIIVLILYVSKRKKHSQLTQAYEDLDHTKEALQDAKTHISKLLEQQVSPEIASALIEETPEKRKQFVAVMFLDIRGFTPIAEKLEPDELIQYQNDIFGFMIEIIQKYHGNINQFMGDGFMATFGAPKSHGEDIKNAFLAGKEIIKQLDFVNSKGTIPPTKVGIGIHAGNVVTGNVGTETRKQFSVTGSTVIIAARIEQLNKKYNSNMIVSQEVNEHLDSADTEEMDFNTYESELKGRTEPVRILVFNEKVAANSR